MKTIKPLRLGVLTRPFENERSYYLSVGIVVFFPFDAPDYLLPDAALWKLTAEELGAEGILDECMPKPAAEVLLRANAYPKNAPQPSCHVRFQMEGIDRTLYVFGDRVWGLVHPSDPEPFVCMPILYSRAFGGPGYDQNPQGKGLASLQTARGEVCPLPNIEHPKQVIASPNDRPNPVGLMPLPISSPLRAQYAGTYDDAWFAERYPGFPADFDWTFFHVAPEEQRFPSFLKGGEIFMCENMHPTQAMLKSRLPTGVARCFVRFRGGEKEELREVSTRIDTVWLFPHLERGAVIYRGVLPVQEDDATDVSHLMVAYEARGAPKTREHYHKVFEARTHHDTAIAVLRDRDLLPELPAVKTPRGEEVSDMEGLVSNNRLVLENARRSAQKRLDQTREDIRRIQQEAPAEGILPDLSSIPETVPELTTPPTLEDLPDVVEQSLKEAEERRKEAMAQVAETEKRVRELCASHGLNYEEMVEKEKERELRRRRRYSAQAHLENMQELVRLAENAGADASDARAGLDDPELVKKLVLMEEKMNEMYARIVHYLPPTLAVSDPWTREELEEGAASGKTFAGRDLTNADLSGLNLKGIDLEGACLEGAKLVGTNLEGANLRRAVLTRADASRAKLVAANLSDANMGSTILHEADCSGARFMKTVLAKAEFKGACLLRAELDGADFMETAVEDADFSHASLTNMVFFQPTLKRVCLVGAILTKAVFIDGVFEDVDLRESNCAGAVFIGIIGKNIRFDRANLRSARLLKESAFVGASFLDTQLEGMNARGADLRGAEFSGANMSKADFSESNLEGARLCRVIANDAVFVRARMKKAMVEEAVMMQAILQKADVPGASFRASNLFRADAMGMQGDRDTSFQGAFVKRVRSQGRRG